MKLRYIISAILFFILSGIGTFLFFTKKPAVPHSVSLAQETQNYNPVLPSIETIFSPDHSWTATLSAARKRTILATGDVIPARSVNFKSWQNKSFTWAFQNVFEKTKNADITFINLETPLMKNCPITNEGMIFCGDARHIEGLTLSGVDVASLANNHAGNHGADGVNETVALLHKHGILPAGISGPVYKDVRGVRFAFLGYNDIEAEQPFLSWANKTRIAEDIAEAKKEADVVVVTFHWGVEYRAQPDARQKELGRFTIDSGADVVIGNHPHWIQPIEIYKGKLITYAHGNFVFDQMWSQKTREGVIGIYTFYDNQLIDVVYEPLQIDDYGKPHFLDGAQKEAILKDMKDQTLLLEKEDH